MKLKLNLRLIVTVLPLALPGLLWADSSVGGSASGPSGTVNQNAPNAPTPGSINGPQGTVGTDVNTGANGTTNGTTSGTSHRTRRHRTKNPTNSNTGMTDRLPPTGTNSVGTPRTDSLGNPINTTPGGSPGTGGMPAGTSGTNSAPMGGNGTTGATGSNGAPMGGGSPGGTGSAGH